MAFKFVLLVACAVFASANAGYTVTSGSDNTYRSPGNLAQVSTQTKTIDTPYSSSSKTDVRVSNPSVYVSAQPALAYSAPASPVYAAPAIYENHHAKLAYAAVPQATVNYASASPTYSYQAAPVTHTQAYYPQQQQQQQQQHVSYQNYAGPSVYPASQQVYAAAPAAYKVAPVAYATPTTYSHAAPLPAAHQPLVKITYSPANEVSHLTYSNVNDHSNYAW